MGVTEQQISKKKASNQMDMLSGSIAKKMLIFTLPIALSSMLQQLFNATDIAVVGRFAGSNALAAVGANSSITALFVNIFIGLSVGANVVIANYVGQKRPEEITKVVHSVMKFALVSGVFIILLGQVLARPLLLLISTPSDVIGQATVYLRIYFVGMPFLVLYNFGASILRSIGDTKRPMYCLMASGIINVILNLLLVIVFHLGVAGVAIATAIASAVGAGLVIYFLCSEDDMIRLDFKKLKIDGRCLKQVIKIGAPAAIQSAVFSLSNVVLQSGINSLGSDTVAGSAAALNFEYLTYFVVNSFAQAAITFTSQNYGAGKLDRCKKVVIAGILEGVLCTAALSAVFTIWGPELVTIFTDEQTVMEYALIRMRHVMMLECIIAFYEVPGGSLRGMGHSLLPAVLTVIGSVCFRIVWMQTVFKKVHTFGVLMSVYPVSWIFTTAMVMTAFLLMSRKYFQREKSDRL